MEVRRRPACQPVLTKLLMSLSQATLFQVEKVSITENPFVKLSGKCSLVFSLRWSRFQFRKLSRVTCSDKYSLKAVEKHYPNLCSEVKYFININSCNQKGKWVAHEVSTDGPRNKLFEENILRWLHKTLDVWEFCRTKTCFNFSYMKENIGLGKL